MSEWREIKLGDLGTIVTGKTPSKKNPEDWGDDTLFITPSDYGNYRKWADDSIRKLSTHGVEKLSNKVLPVGAILVTCIGSDMGKVVMNRKKAITNQQINSIVPNADVVNPDFAYYLLVDLYETLRIYGGDGTAVPIVNKGDFEKIDALTPEKEEQHAIASVLSSLDDKIDLLHRQNQTLEQMAETLFRQCFVEEADESWEEGVLGDLVEVKYGKDHKKLMEGLIPVYGSGGFMRSVEKPLFEGESVLIPRKGTLNNVMYVDEPFWTVDTMFYTIMKKPNLAKFIYQFIKQKDLASMNVGSAVPSMTTAVLNNMPIEIPQGDFLEKFDGIVSEFYSKVKSNQTQIRTLNSLRDTLLPKLMSREVRVE
ncbi:MAG: restriction endonuclease subunit S [Chitinophagales bacterium]